MVTDKQLAEWRTYDAKTLREDFDIDSLYALLDHVAELENQLIDQRNSMEADDRLRAVRKLLEENGCDCPCDHHADERGPDCEVCLARCAEAGAAVDPPPTHAQKYFPLDQPPGGCIPMLSTAQALP